MKIEGMMCNHCTAHVQKALEALDGVESVEVSLEDKKAVLTLKNDVDNLLCGGSIFGDALKMQSSCCRCVNPANLSHLRK